MKTSEKTQRHGGIYNYFEGATINNLVINGTMNKNGTEHFHGNTAERTNTYSDTQIAQALSRIVGKGKAIDSKQKWAGAHWLLRWECNYPVNTQDFCDKIATLQLPEDLEYKCEYRNIREISTLSFMNEDPRSLKSVKYSKNDESVFFQLKEVVIALQRELRKTTEQEI